MNGIQQMSRREFLALTGVAGTGLILGVTLPLRDSGVAFAESETVFSPNVFLQIAQDGTATIWVSRSEMGQGVRTGLPMIVAEEADIPWENVRLRQAPGANDGRYGPQLTGGSLSVRLLYDRLRRCGAVARQVLLSAAAATWSVGVDECSAESGMVKHKGSGRQLSYGDLVEVAASLEVPDPEGVPLKDPESFELIGTPVRHSDQRDYIGGKAVFGLDHVEPGMLYAAIKRCPTYGGTLKSFDASAARAVPGVRDVFEIEGQEEPFYMVPGVAVVAENSWAALEGRRALKVEWEDGPNASASTESLRDELARLAERPGEVVRDDGDVEDALAGAAGTVEARYELPFLAHATLEPMNCTVRVGKDACEIWSPTQNPQSVQSSVAAMLGLPEDKVTVNVTLLGGGFGRRLYPDTEIEAVRVARRLDAPVKVFWSREDDTRYDRYRPASLHVLRGAIDDKGYPVAWHWHILNTHTDRFVENDFPAHALKNYRVEYTHVPFILPRGAWRATVNSQNPFVVHSFLDELAAAGGRDPMDLGLDLIRSATRPEGGEDKYSSRRMSRVIEKVGQVSGWGGDLPPGVGRGTAFFFGYESYCAEVAEVEVKNGTPRVRRVFCAVDCGEVINPDLVEEQCEGAIAFALSTALKQKISVSNGRVQEGNFDDYPMIEIGEMPEVECHIIANHEPPGGMGEVPLPPLFAAVTNAIYNVEGVRIRKLPIGSL